MDSISSLEILLVEKIGWPAWAMRIAAALVVLIILTSGLQYIIGDGKGSLTEKSSPKATAEFRWFQFQYLSVYFTVMLADWLQGTNMYTLYSSYGVNVGTLFLTGFLSSAVFGTFLGMYVDRWGRKLACMIFCVLEIAINLLEHVPSMPELMVGRVLGGLSTSLLFCAFESWMVSEHRKRGFSEELLSSTFAIASWGNGVTAIIAGFLAQVAADYAGDIGPFQLAVVLSFITLLLILPWRENYGEEHDQGDKGGGAGSIFDSISRSLVVVARDRAILCLGLSQAFFEGAVFTFVFMWVPALLQVSQGAQLPTGLVFSCFMLSMTLGGMLFGLALPWVPAETLSIFLYLTAAAAMAVPIVKFEFWWIFVAFLVIEAMVGMFGSCGATLRSKYYPESMQSSIMTVFRLPLNVLVVVGTKLTDTANDVSSLQLVFGVVVGMHLVAFLLQLVLYFHGAVSVGAVDGAAAAAKAKKTE